MIDKYPPFVVVHHLTDEENRQALRAAIFRDSAAKKRQSCGPYFDTNKWQNTYQMNILGTKGEESFSAEYPYFKRVNLSFEEKTEDYFGKPDFILDGETYETKTAHFWNYNIKDIFINKNVLGLKTNESDWLIICTAVFRNLNDVENVRDIGIWGIIPIKEITNHDFDDKHNAYLIPALSINPIVPRNL